MNQGHPIDDLFRQHLAESSVEPPAYMWDRIAQARRRQRQKKGWLWGGSISLVASLLVTWLVWQPTPELGSFTVATTSSSPVSTPGTQAGAPLAAHPTTTPSNALYQATAASAKSTVDQGRSKTDFTRSSQKAIRATITKPRLLLSDKVVAADHTLEGGEVTTSKELAEDHHTAGADALALTDESILENQSRIAGPHQRDRMVPVARLPELNLTLDRDLDLSLFSSSTTRCARFADKFLKVDVEVLAGPAYAHQQLQSRTVEGIPHLQDRMATESARMSYTGGFRIAATSSSGLGLRTGLAYTQLNDRFEHVIGSMVDTSITHQYDPNGNIISSDTTWSSKILTATENNTLRFVEIPLLLTYERKWGKFRVAVNGGAYLNVAFDAEGEFLSPATGEPAPFGQAGDAGVLPVFSKKATAGWYGSATVAYNLHSRMSILAEPFFKTYPRALTNPDYDLQQNYWVAGLQVGLRMRL